MDCIIPGNQVRAGKSDPSAHFAHFHIPVPVPSVHFHFPDPSAHFHIHVPVHHNLWVPL